MDDVLFIDEILIWFEQGYAKLEGTFELKKEITFSTADCGGWLNNRALSGVSGLSSERQMMSKRAGIKLNYHAIARIKRLRTDHSGLMVNSGFLELARLLVRFWPVSAKTLGKLHNFFGLVRVSLFYITIHSTST